MYLLAVVVCLSVYHHETVLQQNDRTNELVSGMEKFFHLFHAVL